MDKLSGPGEGREGMTDTLTCCSERSRCNRSETHFDGMDIQNVYPCEVEESVLGMKRSYVCILGEGATLEMEPVSFPKSGGSRGHAGHNRCSVTNS